MTSSQRTLILLTSACLIALVVTVLVANTRTQSVGVTSVQTTLVPIPAGVDSAKTPIPVDTSLNGIAKQALVYTNIFFPSISGVPQVMLARSIRKSEFAANDIQDIVFVNESTPLVIVVVKGDFDISSLTPPPSSIPANYVRTRVAYIGYIYDLETAIPQPIVIAPSPLGGQYKKLLQDPSIPDDPIVVPIDPGIPNGPTMIPIPPLPTPKTTSGPRIPAPTIMMPTSATQ